MTSFLDCGNHEVTVGWPERHSAVEDMKPLSKGTQGSWGVMINSSYLWSGQNAAL